MTDCLTCGADLDVGLYLELEYPSEGDDVPGKIAGDLCDDCAAKIAAETRSHAVCDDLEVCP